MMNFSIARCLFSIGGCTTILGNISADTAVSSAGAIGGLGVLTIAVNYTLNLLKKKDEQLMAKDARIEALMDRLMDKCPNCELAKAANKSLLDDECRQPRGGLISRPRPVCGCTSPGFRPCPESACFC